jgi:hypothetical protein
LALGHRRGRYAPAASTDGWDVNVRHDGTRRVGGTSTDVASNAWKLPDSENRV